MPSSCTHAVVAGLQPFRAALQKKITCKMPTDASTMSPRIDGRLYHTNRSSRGRAVNEYTSPLSSLSGRGDVIRLTTIVTRKQTVQASIAVQKFCAISLG